MIKPCPFCGCAHVVPQSLEIYCHGYCCGCGSTGPSHEFRTGIGRADKFDEQKAIDAWNTRVTPAIDEREQFKDDCFCYGQNEIRKAKAKEQREKIREELTMFLVKNAVDNMKPKDFCDEILEIVERER